MKKRILSVCLCLVLLSGGVLSNMNTIKVKASAPSAVMDPVTTVEFLMALYSVLETGMIASGAREGLNEYETSQDLMDAFLTFLHSATGRAAPDWAADIEFVTEDGQTVTFDKENFSVVLEDGSMFNVTRDQFLEACLTGTIVLDPDDTGTDIEEDEDFDLDEYISNINALRSAYLEELNAMRSGGGGDDGNNDDENKLFKKIKNITIGTGLVTAVGAFITDLFNGETELDAVTYFDIPDIYYDSKSTSSSVSIYFGPTNYMTGGYKSYTYNYLISNHIYCLIGFKDEPWYPYGNLDYYTDYSIGYATLNLTGTGLSYVKFNSSSNSGYGLWGNIPAYPQIVKSNLPIFPDEASALAYLKTGDDSAATNKLVYDYKELSNSLSNTLAPLTGVSFSPNKMPGINQALSSAAQSIPEPEAGSDTATNTETYKQTMAETLQQVAPEAETDTGTDTDTDTDTVPGTNTGTGTDIENGDNTGTGEDMKGGDYKVDLTMIFPFCLPFDLIAFFQALSAEPVTPVFEFPFVVPALDINESVTIDLSIFDGVMEIFRLGELGCFIIMLIYASGKLIKW